VADAIFADTLYWQAMATPRDPWNAAARTARETRRAARIVTTEEVLTEFLNALCEGKYLRMRAVEMVDAIRANENVTVVDQSTETFQRGLRRYRRRKDKGYSLTDCISMNTMEDMGLSFALTNDRHFMQDGFIRLIGGDE
jgi:uncharacterized protein